MVRRALLVETPFTARVPLWRWLSEWGYTPIRPQRTNDILTWAARQQPELIILAGPVPKRFATCLNLKLTPSTNLLPVIQIASLCPTTLYADADAVLDQFSFAALGEAIDSIVAVREDRTREGVLGDIRLHLPSDVGEQERLAQLLPGWFFGCGLSPFAVQQLNGAVSELVRNAIEWGHGYNRGQLVHIWCQRDTEKITVLVSDSGPGFDRRNLPHAARPGDPLSHRQVRAERNLREGGFGILMAGSLVDHLCYNETGNEGLLIKYLPIASGQLV